jgi:NtrC-family two-component system sensor histidine kinase KinB
MSVQAVFSISVIGAISVTLVIVFSLFLSHLISRPVTELKEAALQVAQGNYAVQVSVRGSDELTLLATQFTLMVEKLKQFHDLNIGRIIAEKQKSEAIIRSVDDGIVVVDDNFLITNLNPEAGKIFGVLPEDSLDKHILEVMRDDQLFHCLKEALVSGHPPPPGRGRKCPDHHHCGSESPLSAGHRAHAHPVGGDNGGGPATAGHHAPPGAGPVEERIRHDGLP